MLTRIPFRSESQRNLNSARIFVRNQVLIGFGFWICALACFLVGLGGWSPRLLSAQDSSRSRMKPPVSIDDMEGAEVEEEAVEEPTESDGKRPVRQTASSIEESEPDEVPQHVIGNGVGTMGRASHFAFRTFGRNDSITPLEYMPYLLSDEHFVFGDLRGFVTNTAQAGGSLGLGYRRIMDNMNAWGGVSVWYDADQTTGKMYQQLGLSFEGLFQQYEVRSNVYIPLSSSQTYSNTITNSSFAGNQLLYNRTINSGTPLGGFDAEVGYSLPVLDRHVVRGYVGGYFFDGGSVGSVPGFKARVEGVINNTVTAQLLYTNDKLYGNNLMVGLSMQFPFGDNHPTTGWTRSTPSPFRFVERNYNAIVAQSQSVAANQVATNPTTGTPYVIEQVNSAASGGGSGTPNGTTANPYSSVAAAQAAGGNVIVVQNGSVLTQPITLTSGQFLLGQGKFTETLATVGGGNVPIPNLLQAAQATTPIIQNVTGPAITLASNTTVGGFDITNVNGNGISGNNVSNIALHDLIFSNISGDAINLTNSSGNVSMGNIQIASAAGNGIVFNGGTPNLVFTGGGSTISATGNGFVLENLTGGSVALNSLSLNNIGGTGLVIDTVATGVNVNSLSVSNTGLNGPSGSAVAISGNTGTTQIVNGVTTGVYNTYNFTGNTKISSPNGAGFSANSTDAIVNVKNLNVTSTSSSPAVSLVKATNQIALSKVNINTQNATGLYASQVSNLLVNGGAFTTVNAPAIDVENSTINASLGSVSVNGGPFGIKLAGSTGTFTIVGGGSYASGGTIQNTTTAGVLINSFGTTGLNWVDFVKNATGVQSTGSTSLALSNLRINGSNGYAVDSLNDSTFALGNSVLQNNGASGGGTVRVQANVLGSYKSYIEGNLITDVGSNAIQLLTSGSGAGSTLTTQISTNTVSGYNNGSSIIGVNWAGPVIANVTSNVIYAYGTNMTAISVQDPSTSAALVATIGANTITFNSAAATSGTAIWVTDGQSGQTSAGGANLTVNSNVIEFLGTGGTGLRFDLYGSSLDTIEQNTITDMVGGTTGMLFDNVGANSAMIITGNKITLVSGDPMTHRGIIFTKVGANLFLDTASGSISNWVYNTTTVQSGFSIPNGPGTGGIIINGTYFQQQP